MALVTIHSFLKPTNAHLVKSKLESEGIQCVLQDDNTVSINPLYSIALGGIRLQVLEEDAPRALKIVQEVFPATKQPVLLKCPKCESKDLEDQIKTKSEKATNLFRTILMVLTMIPLVLLQKQVKCKSCGYEWRP